MKPWRKVKYRDESLEADAPGAGLRPVSWRKAEYRDGSLGPMIPGAGLRPVPWSEAKYRDGSLEADGDSRLDVSNIQVESLERWLTWGWP